MSQHSQRQILQNQSPSLALFVALLLVFTTATLCNAKEGSDTKPGSATKAGSDTKAGSATKEGFVALFNGKDLDNWVRRNGEAEYAVEGGMIVGISRMNTPNSFLCTKRDYADFILELELKVDDGLNSGIQIRSQVVDHEQKLEVEEDGKMVTKIIPAGRVHGYQVEIDPSARAFSGGVYDEARRGWLDDLSGEENAAAREAFKLGEWNTYRIEAIGTSIKTWVNGVPAADFTDDWDASGFFGLQVHNIHHESMAGKKIRWRNIMIKEITK